MLGATLGTFTLILIAISAILYFIPSVVAWKRNHPQKTPIIALNVLLGWTLLGWVGALVWSLSTPNPPTPPQTIFINNPLQPEAPKEKDSV